MLQAANSIPTLHGTHKTKILFMEKFSLHCYFKQEIERDAQMSIQLIVKFNMKC